MIRQILQSYGCSSLILNKGVMELIDEEDKQYIYNQKPLIVTDARSAAFRAFGVAKETESNKVVLLVDGYAFENIYTAVTEMFFQEIKILIIPIFSKFYKFNIDYINRCSIVLSPIINDSVEGLVFPDNAYTPIIMPVIIDKQIGFCDYGNIFDILNEILINSELVFSYNCKTNDNYKFNLKSISVNYKYGILSKYMGFVTITNKFCLLCITPEILELDINIFNNRYLSNNIKIIVYGTDNFSKMKKWLVTNGFTVIKETSEKFSTNFEELLYHNKQSIIIFIEKE